METVVKIFKALGDETRLKILMIISSKLICQKGISKHLQISDSAVSQHIKILKEANIITGYKEGYYVFYKINEESFKECISFMKFINDDLIRFIKFGMVGVLNTLVNWVIFFILNAFGMYYILANIIAYTLGTIHSYLWNTLWVFKYKEKASTDTTIKFVILNVVGLGLNTGILYVLVDLCNLNKFIGLVITTGIVMIINYVVNKLWVFSK